MYIVPYIFRKKIVLRRSVTGVYITQRALKSQLIITIDAFGINQ